MARWAKSSRVARRIAPTGLLPRVAYRAKVIPMAPNPLKQLRRTLGQLLSARGKSRCLSTALLVELGEQEPGISLRLDAI